MSIVKFRVTGFSVLDITKLEVTRETECFVWITEKKREAKKFDSTLRTILNWS